MSYEDLFRMFLDGDRIDVIEVVLIAEQGHPEPGRDCVRSGYGRRRQRVVLTSKDVDDVTSDGGNVRESEERTTSGGEEGSCTDGEGKGMGRMGAHVRIQR